MAVGIIADHSTATAFVWEVCDNVNAQNDCQHDDEGKKLHETFTYGMPGDGTGKPTAAAKDRAYAELVAVLKQHAAVPAASALAEKTGLVK